VRGGADALSAAAAGRPRRGVCAATTARHHATFFDANRRALAAAVFLLLAGCRRPEDRRLPAATTPEPTPRRVVSLAPSLTEIVFALGAGDTLVGVSEYSDYPEAAKKIPRVGGLEVDAEKVAALRPDLVLAIAEGRGRAAVSALEAAGIPIAVLPSGSLDAVLEDIQAVGARLGRRTQAEELVSRLSELRRAVREAAPREGPRSLLLVWPDPPQAAAGGTFLNDVLTEAGARNLVADRSGWPVLSAEYLATAPVELLVVPESEQTKEAYTRAFREGALSRGPVSRARVVRIDESALTRPGPRVFDALERLAAAVR
jgi:iron complex transport system substrate-binding protein